MLLSLVSCSYKAIEPSKEDMTVVGKVNGIDVYLDELRFITNTYIDVLKTRYGEDIFDGQDSDKYIAMLKDLVYSNITANYATILLCDEVGISIGETAVLERVEEKMTDTVNHLGGVSHYKKYLKQNGLTDRLLRFNVEIDIMQNELMYVYTDDLMLIEGDMDKLLGIMADEFICVRHVFVAHTTDNAASKIQSALQRASSGESIETLINELGEDSGMTTAGMYIIDGYMTKAYDDIAFSLKVGDISGVVEDDHGYYIIERLPMSVADVWLNQEELKQTYQTYTFFKMLDAKQQTLTFVPNEEAERFIAEYIKD
jgi:foldase protein PrsA